MNRKKKRKMKKAHKYLMKNKILLLIPAILIVGGIFLVNMQGIIGGAPGEPSVGDIADPDWSFYEEDEDGYIEGWEEDVPGYTSSGFEIPSAIIGITTLLFAFRQWRDEKE